MSKQTWLTGITTSGTPHLGNYVGAIRPAVEASRNPERGGFYFLADYHAMIKNQDPVLLRDSRQQISAAWLALGLDTERATFYRQSDIPEIMEMTWMLTCLTAKGLMNRAHAYKAVVQENLDNEAADPDKGITMGLFSYPILMAADILMFRATHVPVGRDQTQHLEMARDIAQRFNHHYGDLLVMPQAVVDDKASVLAGLDGRKMSKSYGNTIPLFETARKLRKSIMKIKTNSQEPGEPKDPEGNTLFEIYEAFASEEQAQAMRQAYADGIGWGDAKQQLFELVDGVLAEPRQRYDELMANPAEIDAVLNTGAEKARALSRPMLDEMRRAVGVA
ncbi:tryptophan--tRNA ligase [Granulosicoccus sp. 3-233]|uniref:tryptophan--tRNA ligase n=1 Tax=Granulosicoccus sp. 3-233 TaxID=3417969 RepID=UPI003D34C04E